MWIQAHKNLRRLKVPEIEEAVVFNESGSAQVKKEVGVVLVDNYRGISKL